MNPLDSKILDLHTPNPWGRSDALIEKIRKLAEESPQLRVGWTEFLRVGGEMGLDEKTIGRTLGYCFDVFTLTYEREDGTPVLLEEVARRLREKPPNLENLLVFYALKVPA